MKKTKLNLKQWCNKVEKIEQKLSKEYWNLEVGLKYNKTKIKKYETEINKLAEYFLKNFEEPEQLVDANIGAVASTKTFHLSLKFKEERSKKIKTNKHKLKGKPVTWDTWRQFVTIATNKQRKQIYDEFIALTPKISSIIKEKFEANKKIYHSYGTNPLKLYSKEHELTTKKLIKIITMLRSKVKRPFRKQFQYYSKKILNKKPEYYDDMYYVRNAIYHDMIEGFKGIDPIKEIKKVMKQMGLNPNKIKVDQADRPKKYASPFCMALKIPQDVRISFKPENPLNDANSIYHEFGHAVHFSSIKKQLPLWTRTIISNGLAETFSTFFEEILTDYNYMIEELKLEPEYVKEVIRRRNFTKLFGAAFYTGNSLFRIAYWRENLKFKDCDKRYAKEIKKSMGMKIPGAYWKLHHILPESLMYVPSYMLAEIQQTKIRTHLRQKYGKKWWKSKQAGKEILKLMNTGADSKAGDFSKLTKKDIINYVKTITRKI
jgi:oligoendopeptidase F